MFEDTIRSLVNAHVSYNHDKAGYRRVVAARGIAAMYYGARIDGTYALALRALDEAATLALVAEIGEACATEYDAHQWVRANRSRFVADESAS